VKTLSETNGFSKNKPYNISPYKISCDTRQLYL